MAFKDFKIKIILIAFLVVAAGVLLYFCLNRTNENKENFSEQKNEKKYTDEELKKIIPNEIDSLLFSFGIKKEWIKNIKGDKKNEKAFAELWFAKDAAIPFDLGTVAVTNTLTNMLHYFGLDGIINEDPKTRNVNADIFLKKDSLKKNIGVLKLTYNDKVKRDASDVCFVLNNISDFKSSDLNDVLSSPENFSVVLPLTNDKSDIQSQILNSKKDFVLKFSLGKEDDVEADFKSGRESSREWRVKIKSTSYEFTKAGGIILENPIKDFVFEEKIRDEFQKYKMNTYKDTLLMKFASSNVDDKKIHDLFAHIISRTKSGYTNNFYILNLTPAEFNSLDKEIANLEKRGYKFYSFRDMVKKMTAPIVKGNGEPQNENS